MTFARRAIATSVRTLLRADALPTVSGGSPRRLLRKRAFGQCESTIMKMSSMNGSKYRSGWSLVAAALFVTSAAFAIQPDPATVSGTESARPLAHGTGYRAGAYRFRSALDQNVDVATRGRSPGTSAKKTDPVQRAFTGTLNRLTCEQREEARYRETLRQRDRDLCVSDYLIGKKRGDPEIIRAAYVHCDSVPFYRSVLHGDLETGRITLHQQHMSRCDDVTK